MLVTDPDGKYVWVSAGTVGETVSGGAAGTRPGLEGCYPSVRIGGLAHREPPPPCPVP